MNDEHHLKAAVPKVSHATVPDARRGDISWMSEWEAEEAIPSR